MAEATNRVEPTGKKGGEWITFGDEQYQVPPLSFGAIKAMGDRVAALGAINGVPTAEQVSVVLEVVHGALKRNYPEISLEQVADMVDLGNFVDVFGAVLRIAGFRQRDPGEPSGEAQASTGTSSTSS